MANVPPCVTKPYRNLAINHSRPTPPVNKNFRGLAAEHHNDLAAENFERVHEQPEYAQQTRVFVAKLHLRCGGSHGGDMVGS